MWSARAMQSPTLWCPIWLLLCLHSRWWSKRIWRAHKQAFSRGKPSGNYMFQSQNETVWLFKTQFLNLLPLYKYNDAKVLGCIFPCTYSYSLTTTNKSSGWKCNKNDGYFMSIEIFRGIKLNIFKVYCLFSNYH